MYDMIQVYPRWMPESFLEDWSQIADAAQDSWSWNCGRVEGTTEKLLTYEFSRSNCFFSSSGEGQSKHATSTNCLYVGWVGVRRETEKCETSKLTILVGHLYLFTSDSMLTVLQMSTSSRAPSISCLFMSLFYGQNENDEQMKISERKWGKETIRFFNRSQQLFHFLIMNRK